MDDFKYLNVFKQAGIPPSIGYQIRQCLSEHTLDRLTKVGFRRELIKPLLLGAEKMPNGINDENVNSLLDNQTFIMSLIRQYCN